MNFAIIGATGNVGRKTIEVLEKSKIKIDNLFLVASKKSAGKKLIFKKKKSANNSFDLIPDITKLKRSGFRPKYNIKNILNDFIV